jgi:hypothetical protein
MTDERLDQILKQALAPEIDDSEIQIRRKVRTRKMNMKKIIAGGLVACAALSLIVTGGYFRGSIKNGNDGVASVNDVQSLASNNFFAITAYAAELPEGVASGDVMGLSSVSAGYGGALHLDQRFVISGENIDKVRISTDKCNIYSVVPVYEGDADFAKAQNDDISANEEYVMIADVDDDFDEETSTEVTPYHFDHIVIEGNSYEGAYNCNMAFGMSVPEELWSKSDDDAQYNYENIDQVNGATITIAVTYTDGSVEEHHYCLNTGKIFVPVKDGYNDWNNLTRFLTAEEEKDSATLYTYGYLMTKID